MFVDEGLRTSERTGTHSEPIRTVPMHAEPLLGADERLVSLVAPGAYVAEQYRALRHVVEEWHKATSLKVIAVSSPTHGDGKTLTAANLAGALAQAADCRVLLVDADLRRPALHHVLGFGNITAPGLVDGITDRGLSLAQLIQRHPPFNLAVVCSGPVPATAYDVLKSPRLTELLDEARAQYDYVIVDTPPLTPVQDCRVIARWVDGFLLVVAAGRTPRRSTEDAVTMLDRKKVIGLVFNRDVSASPNRVSAPYYVPISGDPTSSNFAADGSLKRLWRHVRHPLRRIYRSGSPEWPPSRGCSE